MKPRFKKTNRPGCYPAKKRAKWVALAVATSIAEAARKYDVSPETVRKDVHAAGHKPRRPGAPNTYGPDFVAAVASHRAASGSTTQTARAFGVCEQTVRRFSNRAFVALPIAS